MIKSFLFLSLASLVACGSASTKESANDSAEKASVIRLSLNDWASSLTANAGIVLDVRTPAEFKEGTIQDAQNIDFLDASFSEKITVLPKDATIHMFCRSGGRSGKALAQMKEMGFENVYELEGGFLAWQEANKPVQIP